VRPVPSEVILTLAPEMTAPALSETVPVKLPVACPYRSGLNRLTSAQQYTARVVLLLDMHEPLSAVCPKSRRTLPFPKAEVYSTADWPYKLAVRRMSRIFCHVQGIKQ